MSARLSSTNQWRVYDRQTGAAKQRAMDRLRIINEIEALVEAEMSKSAAVTVLAQLEGVSVASIWSWLRSISDVSRHDRLAYLVPRFRGGGRQIYIDAEILEAIAVDYLRPEQPSWAECVRRLEALAKERCVMLPHARTLWRRLGRVYDAPTIAMRRGEDFPPWLRIRIPANDR